MFNILLMFYSLSNSFKFLFICFFFFLTELFLIYFEIIKKKKMSFQIDKFFESVLSSQPNSKFEKLPKFLLSQIFIFLDAKNLKNIMLLNKYFFKVLIESTSSADVIWKSFFKEKIDPEIVENHFNDAKNKSPFDKMLNKNLLFVKVFQHFLNPNPFLLIQ